MDIYQETSIRINFSKGIDITPVIVFEGVELTSKSETFNNNTHEIEEVLGFVTGWENSGCDVFV